MKKTIIALTLLALTTGTALAESKYNFSDPVERKAAQEALYQSYTKNNVDRLVNTLQKAVDHNASYAEQAKNALPSLKALQEALN